VPTLSTLLTFVAVVAAFAAVPGPSNLYVVAQGLRGGRRPALAAALGCALAALTYALATVVGLAALLASSAPALSALHYVGGAYLLYLGVHAWRAGGRAAPGFASGKGGQNAGLRSLRRGFVVELSNPKVALFFLAFLPQFVHRHDGAAWSQLLTLGVVFCLVGLASDSLYAVGTGTVRERIGSSRRVAARSERASSALYFGLGGWAIWSGTRVQAQ
jgi:threonine/homoserine/homoserine lactone efflux protein